MSFKQLLSGVLAAIALATTALQATAQVRTPRQDMVQPPARQTGSAPAPASLEDLQQEIDTAWGLSSTEVRSRFADARFFVNTEVRSRADALFRVNDRKVECPPQTIPGCITTTQTIFRGLQSGDRVYNVELNFDYDRLTSVLINGLGLPGEFVDFKQGLESVYGPGTDNFSPEGLGTQLEWRLATTTVDLSYLKSFGGRTALLYYPTPQTSTEP